MDYVLTEGDKLLLQNLVRDVENLKARIARLTSNELDDPWPNGGYVGFTTTSITGRSEEPGTGVLDRPGCGFADIYKAVLYPTAGTGGAGAIPGTGTGSQFNEPCDIDYEMRKVGANIQVLNLATQPYNAGKWVWLEQDRFGVWWLISLFGGLEMECITVMEDWHCNGTSGLPEIAYVSFWAIVDPARNCP